MDERPLVGVGLSLTHLRYAAALVAPSAREACREEAPPRGNDEGGTTNAYVCCVVVSNACNAAKTAAPRANIADAYARLIPRAES